MEVADEEIDDIIRLILRHEPWEFGLEIDKAGWIDVDDLINSLLKFNIKLKLSKLSELTVDGRYSLSSDEKFFRANYGHSLGLRLDDLFQSPSIPPDSLFHGTALESMQQIRVMGIKKIKRDHVFLTSDVKEAIRVGLRHSNSPIVLEIDTKIMKENGFTFYENHNVWLTNYVPYKYIKNCFNVFGEERVC